LEFETGHVKCVCGERHRFRTNEEFAL